MGKLTWTDVREISYALCELHPDRDPLTVKFIELRDLVKNLPQFEPKENQVVNEQILEAIQMAWYEEYQDSH